ncbi:oxidoreductase [Lyophyllum atratum]|nr:oxidoreductase [Lyophyllum atratum]
MTPPIRVGFVGLSSTGWASTSLAPPLLSTPAFKLTALSTTSEASASASAAKYTAEVGHTVKPFHGSTAHIAGDPDVDLVVVSVRTPAHRDAVIPVLEARKDVFVEWPAGASLEETVELAEKAREKGVRAAVGLQGRHSPVVRRVKELIDSGKIGKVLSTTINSLIPREFGIWGPQVNEHNRYSLDPANGATLLSIAVGHQTDIITHLLGDFASVSATSTIMYPSTTIVSASGTPIETDVPVRTPDHIAFMGVLRSGALANVTWRSGHKSTPGRRQFLWEIEGEEGSIRLEGESSFIGVRDPGLWVNGEKVEVEGEGAVKVEWEEFARGEEGGYATLEDAVKNKRLLDAIDRSAREGKRVSLD